MRISDWSSDVCSSDLQRLHPPPLILAHAADNQGRPASPLRHQPQSPLRHRIADHPGPHLRLIPGGPLAQRHPPRTPGPRQNPPRPLPSRPHPEKYNETPPTTNPPSLTGEGSIRLTRLPPPPPL